MTKYSNQNLQTHGESSLDFLRRNKDRGIIKVLLLHSSSDIETNLSAYHTYLLESGIKEEQIMEVDCKALSQTASADYYDL
ncbi:MAG: hypothetical protein HUJ85_07085, partial [Veillonella sp.]|nr:hypothetical protein [Veillonella sp.]